MNLKRKMTLALASAALLSSHLAMARSEERRVGKEC